MLFADITFTQQPQSVAMFTGDDVTLTCQATGVPDVTHYDWYVGKYLYDNIITWNPGINQCKNIGLHYQSSVVFIYFSLQV